MNDDEQVPEARDVAFEFFHVLYRMSDFVSASTDDEEEDEDDVAVEGFDEVCDSCSFFVSSAQLLVVDRCTRFTPGL